MTANAGSDYLRVVHVGGRNRNPDRSTGMAGLANITGIDMCGALAGSVDTVMTIKTDLRGNR